MKKIIFASMTFALLVLVNPYHAEAKASTATTQLGQVQNVRIKKVRAKNVRLKWKKVADAKKYQIRVIDNYRNKRVRTVKTKKTKKTIKKLRKDRSYSFKVRAKNRKKKGKFSAEKTETTKLNFSPSTFTLTDDFEDTTQGTVSSGELDFVDGKSGKGILYDYYYDEEEERYLYANILRYDNTDNALMNLESGTAEVWVKPTADPSEDSRSHSLIEAWSGGTYMWKVMTYGDVIYVTRDTEPCTRSSLSVPYTFTQDQWYKVTLSWRGDVTRLYINDERVDGTFTDSGREVFNRSGAVLTVGDGLFVTDSLRVTEESTILASELSEELHEEITCPNFAGVLEDTQETYKDIELHNFPSQATRNQIKEYIDSLPSSYDGEIEHIALVDDEQYELTSGPTAVANMMFAYRAIFMKESLFDTVEEIEEREKTFFHEAGHAHIFMQGLSYGGPGSGNKRTEWADISGIKNYAGECTIPDEVILEDGFLTAYGSTMPDEDLAEWVGIAFELYNSDETFSSLLKTGSSKYSKKHKQKVDFLLAKGFITQKMYNAITQTTPNTEKYLEFN